jgi:DNA-directed RNA polymerase sigma subunit (sigma70/sigma32)
MAQWGSCVLDIADDGGISDGAIGQVLGLTEKEVNDLCENALKKLRHYDVADSLRDFRPGA